MLAPAVVLVEAMARVTEGTEPGGTAITRGFPLFTVWPPDDIMKVAVGLLVKWNVNVSVWPALNAAEQDGPRINVPHGFEVWPPL